ncbi:MAG: glycosyltransferase family 39 protein [Syntrophaceae bacterium]|nr:glycosyltransferase family 39 protein [Syntrophaceae bacterium]
MNFIKLKYNLRSNTIGIWIILTLCLVLGTAIKLKFLFQGSLWPDEALYLYIARNLSSDLTNLTDISGKIFYHNPPLLMYLLSLLPYNNAADFVNASRTLIVFMGIGTIAITYFIGKKIYNPIVGLIAAAFLAVCPLTNWSSIRILTDIPVVFFIYLAICLLVYDKKAAFYFFGACAVLTKYSAFPVLLLPLIMRLKPKTWAIGYAGLFVALLGFILGRSYLPSPPQWINNFYYYFQIPDVIQLFKETEFFMGYPLFVFTIIGILFTIKEKKYSSLFHWIVLFGIFRFFLPWVIFRVSRYTLPLYPGLLIFAAYGCYRSAQLLALKWPKYSKWVTLFFAAAIAGVLFFHTSKSINMMRQTSNMFIGFDKAVAFLKSQPEPHTIATASPRQMKYYEPRFDIYDINANISPDELRVFIEDKNIHYLTIDLWSPHLPVWCRTFDFSKNSYSLIYSHEKVFIFKVLKK